MRLKQSMSGSSDAWVLAAIMAAENAEPPATLDRVIAYGDALNHAVFNFEELEGGLSRLTEAGLVEEGRGEFRSVGAAALWQRELAAEDLSAVDTIRRVGEMIGAQTLGRDHPPYRLSRVSYQRALEAYSAHG